MPNLHPLIALANHIKGWYIVELNLSSLAYYLPLLSLELLLFYFMRLYYIEGKAIKAQLLQMINALVCVSLYMITLRPKRTLVLKRNLGRCLRS